MSTVTRSRSSNSKSSNRKSANGMTPYGKYGTYEYMRNIGQISRDNGHNIGDYAKQGQAALKDAYGPDAYALIGKKGGDTVACKYWNKRCGELASDDAALMAAAGRNGQGRLSNGNRSYAVAYGKSRKSKSSNYNDDNNDNWNWDNNDNWNSVYGKSRRSANRF